MAKVGNAVWASVGASKVFKAGKPWPAFATSASQVLQQLNMCEGLTVASITRLGPEFELKNNRY